MSATDADGGGVMPEPTLSDDELIIEALAEVLREPGARLVGDGRFFEKTVGPLYARYGAPPVDAALRQIHGDIRRRAASEIRALRMNAACLKREGRKIKRSADGLQT
jgi:hypothetical protein